MGQASDLVDGRTAAASRQRWLTLSVCVFLLLAVGVVFGQSVSQGFVNFDDDLYVYNNPALTRGLTAEGIAWALTTVAGAFWHPLTWLSYLWDFQLYGLEPWGYHLTNVLLHAGNTILLFLVLRRMTGSLGPSAFVAALFAIHPLHVESVAWIAERKDVLSGLFFMLTLAAYVGYVRHSFSFVRYFAVVLSFTVGLMAKPVLVTLPFVLLLLDYWPLGRMAMPAADAPTAKRRVSIPWHLLIEKIPLLLLSGVFCVVAPLAEGNAVARLDDVPMSWRMANAPVAYVTYLAKLFYPVGLAVRYPHPGGNLPAWSVAGALLLLLGISAATLAFWRRFPYLLVGWFWFLGTLVPMSGLVQVGQHAMADRYTYLTQIGLYVALAWGTARAVAGRPYRRWVCGIASASVLAVLMGCAWRQASFWHDSETLWTHTLLCTSRNSLAHYDFACVLGRLGRLDEAAEHYRKALEIQPDYVDASNNLGIVLARLGRLDEAMAHYEAVLKVHPRVAEAHYNFAFALACRGRLDEAIAHYRKGLEIRPDDASAHYYLGLALQAQGRTDEAIAQYQQTVKIQPGSAAAHSRWALALAGRGRFDQSIAHFQRASELKPNDADVQNNLAWLQATCPEASLRNGAEAIEHAQRANQICEGRRPDVLHTLAAAYAEAGRFPEAVATARQALSLAMQQNKRALAAALQEQIARYEAKKPYGRAPIAPRSTR